MPFHTLPGLQFCGSVLMQVAWLPGGWGLPPLAPSIYGLHVGHPRARGLFLDAAPSAREMPNKAWLDNRCQLPCFRRVFAYSSFLGLS
jgi:hypothetical protein